MAAKTKLTRDLKSGDRVRYSPEITGIYTVIQVVPRDDNTGLVAVKVFEPNGRRNAVGASPEHIWYVA